MFGEIDEGAVFELDDGAAVFSSHGVAFLNGEAWGGLQPFCAELRLAIFSWGERHFALDIAETNELGLGRLLGMGLRGMD